MDHLIHLSPDLFILTGDLTAQALPEEFEMAKRDLMPVLEAIPTIILPGNHDLYTRGARNSDRIGSYFEPWMYRTSSGIGAHITDSTAVFTLDPNRPTLVHASGEVPSKQLEGLTEALNDPGLSGKFVVLALHYPVLDRHGVVYDNTHHGLLNAKALIEVLRATTHKPHLILHGHEHHGFQSELDLDGFTAVCSDCGSSGYAHMPAKRRAAAMAVYTVEGQSFTTERYLHDGAGFAPEPGGAFTTGR